MRMGVTVDCSGFLKKCSTNLILLQLASCGTSTFIAGLSTIFPFSLCLIPTWQASSFWKCQHSTSKVLVAYRKACITLWPGCNSTPEKLMSLHNCSPAPSAASISCNVWLSAIVALSYCMFVCARVHTGLQATTPAPANSPPLWCTPWSCWSAPPPWPSSLPGWWSCCSIPSVKTCGSGIKSAWMSYGQ